jgi:DNA polymerase-3 subunit alpha
MVYQEDVIKVAHYFAGLSLAEADYLRRGMSWKFKQRNEFWRVKENFFSNCKEKGYAEKVIEDIWNQIESFANYAFSKGHSASYAVESYQALYLKAYYPLEYMCATLNNGGGFYRAELYVHEARMHGADVHPPCVNNSSGSCEIKDNKIYIGLGFIRELNADAIHKIVNERKNGAYKNLYEFIQRTRLSIETLRLLIRAGAFHELEKDKKKLLWEAHGYVHPLKKTKNDNELFEIEKKKFHLPELYEHELDQSFDEIELLGFPLGSPFRLLKEQPNSNKTAAQLRKFIGKKTEICAYLVTVKHAITVKGERMHFGTFIDTEGPWVDTVHFPPSVKTSPFTGPGCYRIYGKVVEEFDFVSIEVEKMQRLATQNQQ